MFFYTSRSRFKCFVDFGFTAALVRVHTPQPPLDRLLYCSEDHDPTAASAPVLHAELAAGHLPFSCLLSFLSHRAYSRTPKQTPSSQPNSHTPAAGAAPNLGARPSRLLRRSSAPPLPAMASSNPSSAAAAAADGGDDLDQLLDSALDDFTSLDLSASAAPKRYRLLALPLGVDICFR